MVHWRGKWWSRDLQRGQLCRQVRGFLGYQSLPRKGEQKPEPCWKPITNKNTGDVSVVEEVIMRMRASLVEV